MNKKTIFSLIKDMIADHFFTFEELAAEFGYTLVPKKKEQKTVANSSQIQTENYEGDYYSLPVCFEDGKISCNQRDEAIPIGIVAQNFVFLRGYYEENKSNKIVCNENHLLKLITGKTLTLTLVDVNVWKNLWETGLLEKMNEQLKQIRAQPFSFSEKHWAVLESKTCCWWIENGKFCFSDTELPSEALCRFAICVDKLNA